MAVNKNIHIRAALIALAALLFFQQKASADALISPRVFTRGSFVYVVEPQRIVFLSMDTRSSRTLYVSEDDELFSIASAVRYGDIIWASNNIGAVFALDMQTGAIEEFGRGLAGNGGQIDADRRFLWVASGDTLHRMDLTSREWTALAIPGNGISVRGLMTFNDHVHVIAADAVYVLSTAAEDWVTVPHKGFILESGDFYRVNEAAFFVHHKTLHKYDPSKKIWNRAAFRERIRSVSLTPERLAVAVEKRIYYLNPLSFVAEAQPAIPILRNIRSLALHNESSISVLDKGLAFYSSAFNLDIAVYPEHIAIGEDVFAFSYYDHIILYTNNNFVIYNPERKLWSGVRIFNRDAERKDQHAWDENGAYINLTDEHQSTINGTVTIRHHPNVNYAAADGLETDFDGPFVNTTINIRTEDPDGRLLDITLDNAAATLPPQKEFYYKGTENDIFNRALYGVQNIGHSSNRVIHNELSEGGIAVFSSKTKADNSDKNFITVTGGGGHLLSKTEWRIYGYSHTGVYHLHEHESRDIIPTSVKMYIDGIPLSESDIFYNPANGVVRLLRREKSDPTSLIQISFMSKVTPENRNTFEIFPERHFGQYGFVEGAVSPRRWLSLRSGIMNLENNTSGPSGPMVFTGMPIELRNGANHSLLLHPEFAYDSKMGTHSGSVALGARENKAFGSYKGLWIGQDFNGIDKHHFAYQDMRDEHEVNIGYDLRDNLRASWYQFHRRTSENELSHFELRSSYIGGGIAPDVEMSVSSRVFNHGPDYEQRSGKETFSLRFSDLSSRLLGEMNRIHNVGYDFFWTEYQNNKNQHGRIIHGTVNVSPINSLTFTGSGMYRLNPSDYQTNAEINPSLSVYTQDLPRGFDINFAHSVYISEQITGANHVTNETNFTGQFYPEEYVNALGNFIFHYGCYGGMESQTPPGAPHFKYAFFKDEFTVETRFTDEIGLIYFPTDNILLSSMNARVRRLGQPATYLSRERAKWWLENGGSFESAFRIGKNTSWLHLNADALYEHRWNSSLLTGAGVFGTRNRENIATIDTLDLSGGPILTLTLTKDLNGFIKNIENYHHLSMNFNRADMINPDIGYKLYLRLKMPPNISLVGELGIIANSISRAKGEGGIYLHAGF